MSSTCFMDSKLLSACSFNFGVYPSFLSTLSASFSRIYVLYLQENSLRRQTALPSAAQGKDFLLSKTLRLHLPRHTW